MFVTWNDVCYVKKIKLKKIEQHTRKKKQKQKVRNINKTANDTHKKYVLKKKKL